MKSDREMVKNAGRFEASENKNLVLTYLFIFNSKTICIVRQWILDRKTTYIPSTVYFLPSVGEKEEVV